MRDILQELPAGHCPGSMNEYKVGRLVLASLTFRRPKEAHWTREVQGKASAQSTSTCRLNIIERL